MSSNQHHRVFVGSVISNGQQCNDNTTPVEFDGEELAVVNEYGYDSRGNVTDSRGTTRRLFRVGERYVVHVREWSAWIGEPEHNNLYAVGEDDLAIGGDFEDLGRAAGLCGALSLDDALRSWPPTWPEDEEEL